MPVVPAQKAGSRRMKSSRLARAAQPDPVSKTNKQIPAGPN